ncbi:loricrin-like [Anastrepha ludens]|uniref:loricrin-like n=1 Tax=Anastrepha ludens TaxID=28586 RepID=UPI0023B0B203|nr:loricrin-like [Anastrepha ludens]
MNRFLCFFAAILVVANGYATGGGAGGQWGSGGGGGSGGSGQGQYGSGGSGGGRSVIAGRAYRIQPAASVQTVSAIGGGGAASGGYGGSSGGSSGSLSGGYGGSSGGYGGSSGGYGGSSAGSSVDIRSLLAALGGEISAQQAARLALSLPSAGRPLVDTTGLTANSGNSGYGAGNGGNLAYVVKSSGGSSNSAPAAAYSAPAPVLYNALPAAPAASARYGSSAPAAAQISSAAAAGSYISDRSDSAALAAGY